jgi:hypothetical protein
MRLITASLLLALAAGCGGSDSPLDPTGNWHATFAWGSGNCGLTGTKTGTTTVTNSPSGYLLSGTDPNATLTGTISCTTDQCKMSVAETESGTTTDGTAFTDNLSINLTLDTSQNITGSGTFNATFQGGSSCTQTFTVTGTKS